MNITPINLKEAKAFVAQHHRHHPAPRGHKFSIAVSEGDKVVGVAIIGRPSSRHQDDGWTLEVTRLCTDGTRNACSKLYSAAWRAVQALGFNRVITYIAATENGASLRAANWRQVGSSRGGSWSRKNRPRVDVAPTGPKTLFEMSP